MHDQTRSRQFWRRLGHLLGRSTHDQHGAEDRPRRVINVWDAGREAFRQVDLDNRHDPLWDAANQLWQLNATGGRRGGHAA